MDETILIYDCSTLYIKAELFEDGEVSFLEIYGDEDREGTDFAPILDDATYDKIVELYHKDRHERIGQHQIDEFERRKA